MPFIKQLPPLPFHSSGVPGFSPSKERPIGLFSRKANKEKIVDLILEFGHVNTAENDGCSQIICKRCFTKIKKIQKLVTEFREACLITEEKQKETQGRSKRCRCEGQYQQVLKRHRTILPQQRIAGSGYEIDFRYDDEPASSRFTAPGSRTWSQLQLQFQTGAATTSL